MEIPKAPKKKYILAFDGETDGLYGHCWAIGGVVIDTENDAIVDSLKIIEDRPMLGKRLQDQWVKDNILPILATDDSFEDDVILHRLLLFISKWKDEAFCVVDFGCPVETSVLARAIRCLKTRKEWLEAGPYPLHELGTMLHMAGIDPDVNRIELVKHYEYDVTKLVQHNPFDDAITTALIANELLK